MNSEMKKIEILSMQHVNNFGSFIQAYSLQGMLESLGGEVSFLDIEPREEDNQLMQGKLIDYGSELSHTSITEKLLDGYLINRFRNKAIRKHQDNIFQETRDKYFKKADPDEQFDLCVIGSDEVFNCMQESFWGFTSQLFGNVGNADKVITYAACCGFTKLEDVPDKAVDKIRESFGKVKSFSVRDENTYEFVKSISDRSDISYNLDPAVLGNFDKEVEEAKRIDKLPGKYCLIYSYPNRIHDEEDIKAIKEFCKEQGLEIVTIGIQMAWIDKYYAADPFQLLKAFKEASFVITDTFHGTIFSAKYSDKFAIITRGSNQNKLVDLVNRLDLDDHMISSVSEIKNLADKKHDKTKMNNMLKEELNKTMKYLEENLNG